ncbi:hypothetical protein K493DRAFT_332676 [Basidiobolus meristosporus CBS 931.73]|uniref:BCAS3 WD40 domain-containing protein n=1 Tax=Basidiobolus meristosporus CBS 931.73 TaxID=1314790 RepID=A0A1Y1ZCQ3_9FUNG|nr:hypothetical protein K493DRAFT_332676 [Basidiobolus meristosporus CBS 931.73]|eukprot:ORY07595.1 hypothetical protein K493DRAFT_332676 [Basidiobolus meristosporus CBS 931.73]
MENISTMLQGLSNYVTSLPESLAGLRKSQSQSTEDCSGTQDSPYADTMEPPIISKKRVVLYASFDWIWGVFPSHSPRTLQRFNIRVQVNISYFLNNDRYIPLNRRLCLMLGYEDGFQIWDIMNINDIKEIFSYIQDKLQVTCIKPLPEPRFRRNVLDEFKGYRTLIAVVSEPLTDHGNVDRKSSKLDFFSLKTHSNIKTVEYKHARLMDIKCNDSIIVLVYISSCLISNPITEAPVIALGDRLIAYATSLRTHIDEGSGRDFTDRVFQVEKVAKNVVHGVKTIGYKALSSYFAGSVSPDQPRMADPKGQINAGARNKDILKSDEASGMVRTFHDSYEQWSLRHKGITQIIIQDAAHLKHGSAPHSMRNSLHHFKAHNHRVAAMTFNHSGNLLATASTQGTSFKVFEINNNGIVNNMYKLSRGYTFARVAHITFSTDSKWLAVGTSRGTTPIANLTRALDVFAINPYGGHTNVASHVRTSVANEKSRFNRRAYADKAINLAPVTRLKQKGAAVENDRTLSVSHPESNTFEEGRTLTALELTVNTEDVAEWSLARGQDWGQVYTIIDAPTLSQKEGQPSLVGWILQSETSTHPVHISPLWLSPQFTFQTYDPEATNGDKSLGLPPSRTLNFKMDNPLPYGVYRPKNMNESSNFSEEDLENHLLHAMGSKMEIHSMLRSKQPASSDIDSHADPGFTLAGCKDIEIDGIPLSSTNLAPEEYSIEFEYASDTGIESPPVKNQSTDWNGRNGKPTS